MTLRLWTSAALVLLAGSARADTAVDAQIFKPALDTYGVFATERVEGLDQWDFAVRFGVGFAQEPLKLTVENTPSDTVLKSQTTFDFGFAFGLSDRLTFAFDVPLQLQPLGPAYGVDGRYHAGVSPNDPNGFQPGTGFYSMRPDQNIDPSENTVGDPRVGLKLRLTGKGDWGAAVQAVVHAPFGDEDVFAGSAGFTFEPRLIFERRLGGRGFIALNLGARLRDGVLVQTRKVSADGFVRNDPMGNPIYEPLLYVGSEAAVSLGAKIALVPRIALGAEVNALIPLAHASDMDCPDGCRNGDLTADVLGGAFVQLTADTALSLAGGAGVISDAARRDAFRILAALTWSPSAEGAGALLADRDGDGIPDRDDLCPDEPEDKDGFQDEDGCPDPDNDLDGIPDALDKCPNQPEDKDGFQDEDGCPDPDNDGDGIPDVLDKCPNEPEDRDGFQDEDGCPDPDNDGDGILDKDDKCPNEPETVNGVDDFDGCPDQAVQGGPRMAADRVDLQGERIEFVGRSARLTAPSQATLDAVAQILKGAPTVRIRVEVGVERSGDSKRSRDADRALSTERARAVQAYLFAKGVKATQVDAAPLGSDRPIDAKNPKDPRVNRRVELIRVTQ
jgi:outer membrane protein OmpA-like peptidoglycan-associated protein